MLLLTEQYAQQKKKIIVTVFVGCTDDSLFTARRLDSSQCHSTAFPKRRPLRPFHADVDGGKFIHFDCRPQTNELNSVGIVVINSGTYTVNILHTYQLAPAMSVI